MIVPLSATTSVQASDQTTSATYLTASSLVRPTGTVSR